MIVDVVEDFVVSLRWANWMLKQNLLMLSRLCNVFKMLECFCNTSLSNGVIVGARPSSYSVGLIMRVCYKGIIIRRHTISLQGIQQFWKDTSNKRQYFLLAVPRILDSPQRQVESHEVQGPESFHPALQQQLRDPQRPMGSPYEIWM